MKRSALVVTLLAAPVLGAWLSGPSEAPEDRILGMWSRFEPVKEGDPVRFYYFHKGGIGLFRYGKLGLTYTRTFRWSVEDQTLDIQFVKDGAQHEVGFSFEGDDIVLERDPVMGGEQRYGKRTGGVSAFENGLYADHPFARMWIHRTRDKNGEPGFELYQLQAPSLDGRGVGWFHRGDYAEWSTEALTYRKKGDTLELTFALREERHSTGIEVGEAGGQRFIRLESDPRNYWHPQRYEDGGPGFTMLVSGEPIPFRVHGHGHGHGGHGCGR